MKPRLIISISLAGVLGGTTGAVVAATTSSAATVAGHNTCVVVAVGTGIGNGQYICVQTP